MSEYGYVELGLEADVVLNRNIEDVVGFLEDLRNEGYIELHFDFDPFEGRLEFYTRRPKTREEFEAEQERERERRLRAQYWCDRERRERAEYERLKAKFEVSKR